MDKRIDLIMSSVQQFCQEGYLLPKERQTLFDLAELHGIDKTELENVLTDELDKVRKERLDSLYKAAKQPDAALGNNVEMFQQSRRQFPDMLKLGTLKLKLNKDVKAPAFVPINGMTGLCIVHNNNAELACNIIQNVAMRLLLSIPRSLARVSIVDPTSMGADYIGLSGIDSHLLKVIDDEKQVQPFLQTISKESASFNFNGLGSSFADIAEYNRANRSKARPYQLIILSDFQNILDKNILAEIKKINKLASKTGVFFLFSVDSHSLIENLEIFDVFKARQEERPNICIIDTDKNELHAGNSDEVAFFNNAYDFEIDQELLFNANTIQQLNHEYDPNTYPLEQTGNDRGDYCIESLNIIVGKFLNKEKAYNVSFKQTHDNAIVVSQEGEKLATMGRCMIQSMVTGYKQSELAYMFYNCDFIPKYLTAENIVGNIHANKLGYLQTLLVYLKQEMETRNGLFQEANASNYEAYRNMADTPLPRIICVLGSIETLLNSESMNTVESVMLLDQLLDQAGHYGIHFLLFGKPSANLFKLNLTEHVRFKMFGSLNEDEVMQIGIFATEDEINHQNQQSGCILHDGQQTSSAKLEVLPMDDKKWNNALRSFTVDEGCLTQPKVFMDLFDTYPESYRGVNVNTIADSCLASDIPIGIPRYFTTQFSSVGHDNVMIVGDDTDGEMSILTSVYTTMKRSGRLSSLCVFDASDSNLTELQGVEIYSDFDKLPLVEDGIMCLLHMDALDPLYKNKVYTLMEEAEKRHIQVLLFAKDHVCISGYGLTETSFMTRIALYNAPEGFISPVHFYTNDEITLPTVSMQALLEQTSTEGGMDVNSMWLFNY